MIAQFNNVYGNGNQKSLGSLENMRDRSVPKQIN
jgi:hypothetical protein